jgi:hypothetical protein
MDNKFLRWNVNEHEPAIRCIATVKSGQCPYVKDNNTDYCPMHGANKGVIKANGEVRRNYQLRRWKNRVDSFADNDQIKSLREEIGILRMVMEELLNKCEDSTDLLMTSHRIADVAMKIEKLVVSCDKLENRMGLLLSKRAVVQLAGEYVQIINNYVSDPDTIERISEEMICATERIDNLGSSVSSDD